MSSVNDTPNEKIFVLPAADIEEDVTPEETVIPEATKTEVKEIDVAEESLTKQIEELLPVSDHVVASKILPIVLTQAKKQLVVENARALSDYQDRLNSQMKSMVQKEISDWKAQQKPLEEAEIQTLLEQAYLTFEIKIPIRKGDTRIFTIMELPQAAEMKFVESLKTTLIPKMREANSLEWNLEGDLGEKMQRVVDLFPPALISMAEMCAICLDPHGDESIKGQWVTANMSSYRIIAVILAQVEANRLRDFFSLAYRFMN